MENSISNEILTKVTNIDNSLSILTHTFVIGFGIVAAIFVCYLMYKLIDNFISF